MKAVDVDAEGISAGTHRILWRELAKLRARRLPADAPFEKLLIVDLVPKTGEAIRLLTSSTVETSRAPFTKATTAKETLRRLLAHARDASGGVDVDPGTAAFITGAEAPVLGAIRQLVELEATY
jgi:hypothetical protein